MKRLILGILALLLCGVSAASADENVRAAQARLREGGFYFGEVTGTFSSDTAAAITRYQIRNGLQISGQLDAATAKSLRVAPASANAPAQTPDAETWRRLRKPDQQFLTRMNTTKTKTARKPPSPASPPPAAPDADADAGRQTFTLSQERLRDYVGAFVLAGLNPGVGSELEFFAPRVDYYNEGIVDRARVRDDLQKYNERWPVRRFWLAGAVAVEPQPDSRLRVTFPLRFELQNGARRSSGKVQKTLLVEVAGEDELQIVAVNERKVR